MNHRPSTLTRRVVLLWCALAALAGSATAASIFFGQIRYLPEGYSTPVVSTDGSGNVNYTPSIPTGFKERTFGTELVVDNSTLHPNLNWGGDSGPHLAEPKVFYLDLGDGRQVPVRVGSQVQISGETFVVVGMINGDFYLKHLATRAYLKFTRQTPAAAAGP